jgi:hypothetical protein
VQVNGSFPSQIPTRPSGIFIIDRQTPMYIIHSTSRIHNRDQQFDISFHQTNLDSCLGHFSISSCFFIARLKTWAECSELSHRPRRGFLKGLPARFFVRTRSLTTRTQTQPAIFLTYSFQGKNLGLVAAKLTAARLPAK